MTQLEIRIRLDTQQLELLEGDIVVQRYPVSTAKNGPGELDGSECTPRGAHQIARKIGEGAEPGAVFVGREATGEICSSELFHDQPERDWILTRILWLDGCEPGRNQGGSVDTKNRYIYIHGCPEPLELGVPGSHGCIRMSNADVIDLFDRVDVGTPVEISESSGS